MKTNVFFKITLEQMINLQNNLGYVTGQLDENSIDTSAIVSIEKILDDICKTVDHSYDLTEDDIK